MSQYGRKIKYISIRNASRITRFSSDFILGIINEKKIRSFEKGGSVFVDAYEIIGYKEKIDAEVEENRKNRKDGRKRKNKISNILFSLKRNIVFTEQNVSDLALALRMIIKTTKHATIISVVLLVLGGGLFSWAIQPQTETIEIFATKYEGDWQNMEGAFERSLFSDSQISQFSGENSASSVPGLNPRVDQNVPAQSEGNAGGGIGSPLNDNEAGMNIESAERGQVQGAESISIDGAGDRKEEANEGPVMIDSAENETSAEGDSGSSPVQGTKQPEVSQEIPQENAQEDIDISSNSGSSGQQEAIPEAVQENISNETSALKSLDERMGLFEIHTAQAEGPEGIENFVADENDSFENASGIILPDVDGNSSSKFAEDLGLNLENTVIYTKKTSVLYSNFHLPEEKGDIRKVRIGSSFASEGVGGEDDEVLVEWSLDGSDWKNAYTFKKDKIYSNSENGGYSYASIFDLSDPNSDVLSWDSLGNLKVRFVALSNNENPLPTYLDAVWLEAEYAKSTRLPADRQETDAKAEIKSISDRKDFRRGEEPELKFHYQKKQGMIGSIVEALGLGSPEGKIKATGKIIDSEGDSEDISTEEIFENNGDITIKLKKERGFRPGLYKIVLTVQEIDADGNASAEETMIEQEFTWGVLTINTNKSIYVNGKLQTTDNKFQTNSNNQISNIENGELAYLQMGVLNDDGHTVCDAKLLLSIKYQVSSEETLLSTEDGTIEYSGKCNGDNVTDVPDYFAHYKVGEAGIYQMTLTRIDPASSEKISEISDSFEVRDSVSFEVERIGPTRIWPMAPYEMTMNIKANQDFEGMISESVPSGFEVSNIEFSEISADLNRQTDAEQNAEPREDLAPVSGDVSQSFAIKENENGKSLDWQVALEKGKNYQINYQFDAPDISPYIYLLGPLSFKEFQASGFTFQESRSWQIASDAITIQSNWASQYASATYPSGAVNASYTIAAGVDRLLVVAIASSTTAATTQTVSNVTYGGQSLTLAAGDAGTSRWNHTYLYYLNDAGIAAASGTSLNVTITGGTSYYNYIYAAVFAGADQSTIYTDAQNFNSSAADSAIGGFASGLTVAEGDQAIEIINLARSVGGTTARVVSAWSNTTWPAPSTVAATYNAVSGPCVGLHINNRNVTTAATETSGHTAGSTSTYDSMTGMSIKMRAYPGAPTLYNDDGGSNQIAFSNTKQNDATPIVRVSSTHSTSMDRFQVEFNTASDFTGTAYTETFSGTYSSATAYNLQTTGTLGLPTTDGVTYYVRARASDNSGSVYGDWSSDTWTYTYTGTAGSSIWHQTTDKQFNTGTLSSASTSGSNSVELGLSYQTISLVGSATGTTFTSATASPAATFPAGDQSGDVYLAWVVTNATHTISSVTGWVQIGSTVANGSDSSVSLLRRVADGTEGASWTFTNLFTATQTGLVVIAAWRNVDNTTPINTSNSTSGTVTTASGPSITPNSDSTMIVQLLGADPSTSAYAGTDDASPDATEIYDAKDSGSLAYAAIQYYLQGAQAALALDYTGLTSDTYGYFQVALNPASSLASSGTIMSPEIDYDWANGASGWSQASFATTETNGDIKLKVYYTVTTPCDTIVPDGTLTGNSTGFDVSASPVSISGLTPVATTYNKICLQANLSDSGGTPYLLDWTASWSAGINISGTVWTNEAKTTNIGINKTVHLFVNGTDKSTAETNSSGQYSFAGISGISANDSVIVYLDGETEDGSTVTLAVDGTTAIANLDIFTSHISLESRTASAIANADLDDVDGVDAGDEDLITIAINGADENATYASGMELYIVNGDSYTPGGTVTTAGAGGNFHITGTSSAATLGTYTATISGNIEIDTGTTLTSTSGTLSVAGNWTNAGTFTHNSGIVTFNGSAAQTITTGGTGAGKDFNNVTFSNSYGTPPNITFATNAMTIGGNVILTQNTSISSTNLALVITGTINGANTLSIDSGSGAITFSGIIGGSTPIQTLAATSSSAINLNGGAITLSANYGATFTGPAVLGAGTTINVSGTAHTVNFTSTINGANTLTISGGASTTATFGGVIGGTTPIRTLAVTATTAINLNGGAIILEANYGATFTGPVVLGAATTINVSGTAHTINFTSTINGANTLTISGGTNTTATFGGIIGGTTPIRTLAITATTAINLNGGAITLEANYGATFTGPAVLGAGTTINVSGTAHTVNFTSTINGANTLTISGGASTTATFGGVIGGTTPITSLAVNGGGGTNINATGITTRDVASNTVSFSGPVTLGASTIITTDNITNDGTITFSSTANGTYNLTVNAGTAQVTFGNNVGASQSIGVLTKQGSGDLKFGTSTLTCTGLTLSAGTINTLGTDSGAWISTGDVTISSGTLTSTKNTLTIGNNYSNSGTFTANGSTVKMNATSGSKTLSGTMTGTSSFWNLTFDGLSGGWSFGNNVATISNNFTITNGTVTAPANTYDFTIGGNFSNAGTFTHNSGTATFGSGWSYKKSHVITNNIASDLTNYQVKIITNYASGTDSGDTVYLNSKSQADFDDIRFTDSNGNQIDYWLESKTDSSTATFWVEVPSIPASSTATIYVLYGNASAANASNGNNTFIFFDDFTGANGSNPDTSKWTLNESGSGVVDIQSNTAHCYIPSSTNGLMTTISSFSLPEIIEANVKASSLWGSNDPWFGLNDKGVLFGTSSGVFQIGSYGDTWTTWSGYSLDTWYKFRLIITSADFTVQEDSKSNTYTKTAAQTAVAFKFGDNQPHVNGKNLYMDDIRIRQYASTVPSHTSWGSETMRSLSGTMTGGSSFNILTFNDTGGAWIFGANSATAAGNFTITAGTLTAPSTTLTIGGNYSNSGTFTHNSGSVAMNAADTDNTLSGTMTGASSFYNLTFNNAAGRWTFGNNSATVGNDLVITASETSVSGVTAPGSGYNLIVAGNFTNTAGKFTHNSGAVNFNGAYGWSYKKAITLTAVSALTDYQVKVIVNTGTGTDGTPTDNVYCGGSSHCQVDFDDVRFTDANGVPIDYWLEDSTVDPANFWVEVPSIATTGTVIYMLYGNAGATTTSNGANTFVDYSDFTDLTGWTQQAGTWTVSSGVLQIPDTGGTFGYLRRDTVNPLNTDYVVRLRLFIDESTLVESNHRLLFVLNSANPLAYASTGNYISWYEQYLTGQLDQVFHNYFGGGSSSYTTISDYPAHTWLKSEVKISEAEDKITLWSDNLVTNYGSHATTNTRDDGDYWGFFTGYSKGQVDWVLIRQYAATEPTKTFGAETSTGGTITPGGSLFYDIAFNGLAETFAANAATVVNNFTITSGTVTAPSTTLNIAGNYSNSGIFTHNSGLVTFDGAAQQTLSGTMTGSSSFYDLTLANNSGTNASDDERTSFVPGIIFSAAATSANNFVITTASSRIQYLSGATYTFNNINWNGQATGTKVFFRNSAITGTWLLKVTGTQTAVSYVNVSRSDASVSGGSAIQSSNGTNYNGGNTTNWLWGAVVSGKILQESVGSPYEGTTKWASCDGSTLNISWALDGADQTNVSCVAGDGSFSLTVPFVSANQVLAIWLDTGGGDKGVLYLKNNDTTTAISGLTVFKNKVWIQSQSSQSISNSNINSYDKSSDDTDIPIDSDGTNATIDSGVELHINTGDTYAPAGNVAVDKVHLLGVYTGGTETLTLNGSGASASCDDTMANLRPLCVSGGTFTATSNTVSYAGSSASTVETLTYNNFTHSGSGTGTLAGSLTIGGDLNISGGVLDLGSYTASRGTAGGTLTVANGAKLKIGGTGTLPSNYSTHSIGATSTVEYAGTTTTVAALNSSQAYGNLTISGSGVSSTSDFTVNGILALTSDLAMTDPAILTMGGSATTSGASDVTGIVRRTSFVADTAYSFGSQFTTFDFSSAGTLPTDFRVKLVKGSAPSWKSDAILRNYDIIRTDGGSPNRVTMRLHYADSELNGITPESDLVVWDWHTPSTAEQHGATAIDTTNDYVQYATYGIGYFPTSYGSHQFSLAANTVAGCHWNGIYSTDWGEPTDWSCGRVPLTTDAVYIPDASTTTYDPTLISGAVASTIDIEASGILNGGSGGYDLTVSAGADAWENLGTFNAGDSTVAFSNANATVSGTTDFFNLSINSSAGLRLQADSITRIAGTMTNNGTWYADEFVNTVEYNGASQTVLNPNDVTPGYYNLILSGSGTKTMPATAMDIDNDFTTSGTASATAAAALTIDGDVVLGSGTVFNASNDTHNVAGNWTNNGATFTASTSTVNFDGAVAQTITGTNTWNNLTINNTNGTPNDTNDVDPGAAQTVSGTLTVTDGQWTPYTGDSYGNVSIGASGIMKPDASASISVSGSWTNSGTFTHNSGTATFGSGWSYKKSHVITNNIASELTNYQIKIITNYGTGTDSGDTVYLNSKSQADFDDVRFTDANGNLIDYWLESKTDSSTATFWVEVPSIPASSTATIYILYGNAAAASASSGTNTFYVYYDNTSTTGWTLGGDMAVTTSGDYLRFYSSSLGSIASASRTGLSLPQKYALETYYKTVSVGTADFPTIYLVDSAIGGIVYYNSPRYSSQAQWGFYDNGTEVNGGSYTEGTDYILQVTVDEDNLSTGINYRLFDTSRSLLSSSLNRGKMADPGVNPVNTDKISFGDGASNRYSDAYHKWIFVRQYAATEPSHTSWGSETVRTITDGGSAFYDITFNDSGSTAAWLYQDGASTAPNQTTVSNGTPTYLNAKTGTVSVAGGTLNVDWYLGVHAVDAVATATDINTTGDADVVVSENSGTPAATVWRHNGTVWSSGATSQTTGTAATGKNPQPNSDGAIRIREYSMTASASCPGAGCTLYNYNIKAAWQSAYGQYDYYADYGGEYLKSCLANTSACNDDDTTSDDTIGVSWYRSTASAMNGSKEYDGVNNPPTQGSWYVGLATGLSFSINSFSVDLGDLDPGAVPANGTNTLTVTTSATNGYVISAWTTAVMTCSDVGSCGTETIPDWTGNNAIPTSWANGEGFGYSTNDITLLTGTADRFSGPKYAKFVNSGPGDLVADRSGAECPCSGQENTITYRIAASTSQRAGPYSATVIYVATPQY